MQKPVIQNKFCSRVWDKTYTQSILRKCRTAGYTVNTLDAGYSVKEGEEEILEAMQGRQGYLVRYNPSKLFVSEANNA